MPPKYVTVESLNSQKILHLLNQEGGEARFVGGCVRDHLLTQSYTDIDIATTHVPEEVVRLMDQAGIKTIPTGIKHGTVTAMLEGQAFEITTLRKDTQCDGRHAEVEYTSKWEEDAARRDFTINALYMDAQGEIYDYFNGQEDLANKVIRFVGDPVARIQEDYLRILRFFRFQSYYSDEFKFPMQLEACAINLEGLAQLSGERIQAEMLKILSSPRPLYVLMVMNKIGLFNYIIPNLNGEINFGALKQLLRIEKFYPEEAVVNPYVRLAAMLILGNYSQEFILDLGSYWKFSSDNRNFLAVILSQEHEVISDMDRAAAKREIRVLTKDYFIATCVVRWAAECHFVDDPEKINQAYKELIDFAKGWKIPIMPIRGRDLLDMGVGEGKEVGALLKKAEAVWEANDYRTTREELFALVRSEMVS